MKGACDVGAGSDAGGAGSFDEGAVLTLEVPPIPMEVP